jgi:hypothetical protein
MSITITKDVSDLIEAGLLSLIKNQLFKNIEDRLVEDFRENIKPILFEEVEKITTIHVKHMHDDLCVDIRVGR